MREKVVSLVSFSVLKQISKNNIKNTIQNQDLQFFKPMQDFALRALLENNHLQKFGRPNAAEFLVSLRLSFAQVLHIPTAFVPPEGDNVLQQRVGQSAYP